MRSRAQFSRSRLSSSWPICVAWCRLGSAQLFDRTVGVFSSRRILSSYKLCERASARARLPPPHAIACVNENKVKVAKIDRKVCNARAERRSHRVSSRAENRQRSTSTGSDGRRLAFRRDLHTLAYKYRLLFCVLDVPVPIADHKRAPQQTNARRRRVCERI